MKQKKLFALPLAAIALLALFATAHADDSDKDKLIPYKLLTTIAIPGGLSGFDISWVDSESGKYYLADRGNAKAIPPVAPRVDVIDTKHDKFLYSISGFAGPNGVVAVRRPGDDDEGDAVGELWVGDANSTAKIVDLAHPFAVPFAIPTGGTMRADELAYDPADQIILIANDRDTPPFVTFISTKTRSVLGQIKYDGLAGHPKATAGIEQPVWDGAKGKFYIAIPATTANPKGEVDEINPTTRTITRTFVTTCGPAGLALIPLQRLITSCGDVIDIGTGLVVHTVTPTVAGDEIWYNPGDERVYIGGFVSVPVVSGLPNYGVIGTLPWTGFFAPPPPQFSHSIAADSELNRIFLPVTNVGVMVFTDDRDNGEGPDN